MSDLITVEALDVSAFDADGALAETEDAVAGDTRGAFFARPPSAAVP
jgi:hypothetical protein